MSVPPGQRLTYTIGHDLHAAFREAFSEDWFPC